MPTKRAILSELTADELRANVEYYLLLFPGLARTKQKFNIQVITITSWRSATAA